ncbi:MAG: exopolysaccharide biosynthesis polyprenyl glycosylphosphotransferase [Kiritimatiellia bacterium]|jgi:exopolysaccharide biosynthesis polyprenyl glycosylphosphotransferase
MSDGLISLPSRDVRNRYTPLVRAVRVLHMADDLLALVISYFLAYALRFGIPIHGIISGKFQNHHAAVYFRRSWVYIGVMFVVLFVAYALLGMYDGHQRLRRTPLLWNAIVGNGFVIACVAVYLYFFKRHWHMRGFIPLALLINIPMTVVVRMATNGALTWARRRHPSLRGRVLLVGETRDAETLKGWASHGLIKGWEIVQQIPSPKSQRDVRETLPSLLTDDVSAVFVMDREMEIDVVMDIVRLCARRCKTVKALIPRFLTLYNPYASGDEIEGIPIVHFSSARFGDCDNKFRRGASRLMALGLFLLASPVLLLVSLLIRLDGQGPALFIQDRFGREDRVFRMYKFRTMCRDAEARLAELRRFNEADGALFKMKCDPRVTPLGRFLRKTSIDELPQLINILRGEMRLVGPRPLPVGDLEGYRGSWHFMRQLCSPGITCIWQVSGRSGIGFEDMCLLDIWYLLNRDWGLDVRILIRTAWVVVFRHGAY